MAHEHRHAHKHEHGNISNIKVAFILNLVFTLVEIAGGILTNSVAILSDALHDLGDSLSLGVAWYLDGYSKKGPDKKFSYGYARFSLLGALVSSLILVIGSVFILTKAIPRILSPQLPNAKGMLILAVLGIVINGAAVLRLRNGKSLNERAVSWHLLEDVLGWAAVLVVGVVLLFADVPVLDPVLSIIITAYVLFNVIKNLKEIFNVFLEGVPKSFSINEIQQEIAAVEGVLSVHHTHIWSMEGENNLLSTHVVVSDDTGAQEIIMIKSGIREHMKDKGIGHVTIEVDYEGENCTASSC